MFGWVSMTPFYRARRRFSLLLSYAKLSYSDTIIGVMVAGKKENVSGLKKLIMNLPQALYDSKRSLFLLDLMLVVTALLLVFTDATVLFFHVVFFLLTLGAFYWKLRGFIVRALFWVTVTTLVVLGAVLAGNTQAEELIEIPLLTSILILVYSIARQRSRAETVHSKSNVHLKQEIAERKRAEETLETANVELVRAAEKARELVLIADAANRAKNEFLANTSHELRTPLTGVIGLLQIVNDDLSDSPEEEREFVQTALGSANHLLGVVNDVLDITNVEAGRLEISLERMRLADVLDKVQKAVGMQAQQKGLALQFDSAPGLYVQTDPARLRQVLLNLVGNAIKFTETGRVSVSAQPAADPDYALIEITDTGVGIAPQFLPSAFDKFSQADGSFSRVHGGTGLGLAITRGLVEMMHGQVGLASEGVGHGTRAWLTMPLAGNN